MLGFIPHLRLGSQAGLSSIVQKRQSLPSRAGSSAPRALALLPPQQHGQLPRQAGVQQLDAGSAAPPCHRLALTPGAPAAVAAVARRLVRCGAGRGLRAPSPRGRLCHGASATGLLRRRGAPWGSGGRRALGLGWAWGWGTAPPPPCQAALLASVLQSQPV